MPFLQVGMARGVPKNKQRLDMWLIFLKALLSKAFKNINHTFEALPMGRIFLKLEKPWLFL
jgi:hypothetical protein